ncbi:MAG: histidine kinase [Bacteroidota bacterium]
MYHPFLSRKKSLYVYATIWLVISIIHAVILFYIYNIDLQAAAIDSLIFNSIFAGLGLGLWYIVRFVDVEKQGFFYVMINHLAALAAVIFLWFSLGKLITGMFLGSANYQLFLKGSFAWRLLIGIFFYSVVVLLYYLIKYYGNFQEKMQQEADLNAVVKETELALLRSQINPHFIFNSLNSISSLTMTFPEKAQEMTIKLSDFLRYSLAQGEKNKTTLSEEIHNAGLYMDIEKTRFGSRLIFEPQLDAGCLEKLLPNMILQPLLENAIKHGVYESLETVTIRFGCAMENNALKISIWNNFDPEGTTKKGAGTGLRNIKNRLQLLYGQQDLLTINRTEDTYEVVIIIPQT